MDGSSTQKQTTTQTVTRALPTATPEELRAQQIAAAQLEAYERELTRYMGSPLYTTAQDAALKAQQNLLGRVSGTSPVLLPQEEAYLGQAFDPLLRQAEARLRQQALEDAQRRGMTLTDSPTGGAYLQALADLQSRAASDRAQAALNLSQQNFGNWTGLSKFGQDLAQQAQNNRLALSGSSQQLQQNLFGQRLAAAPVTTTGTSITRGRQPGAQTFGQVASGLGSLAGGIFGREGAYNPLTRLGAGAVDLFGNIRNTFNQRQMQQAPAPYGNVANIPNYGINQDYAKSWWD